MASRAFLALTITLILSAATSAQAADVSLPAFAGVLRVSSTDVRYSLRWSAVDGTTFQSWKRLGEKAGDFELVDFDPSSDTLSLRHSTGRTYRVSLPGGRVQSRISNDQFKHLNSFRDPKLHGHAPMLDRATARAYWMRLIEVISRTSDPGVVIDLDGKSLPEDKRKWFLEGRDRAKSQGQLFVVVLIDGKPTFHQYPRNQFGLPEPMTRNLTPSDWEELSLLSVTSRLPQKR